MQMVDNEIATRSRYLDTVIAREGSRAAGKIGATSIAESITPPARWRRGGGSR